MIDKSQLFLYEYLKICNEYFKNRDKSLLTQINDMYNRDLNTKEFVFNSLPKMSRYFSGRVNLECAEDISSLEVGDTFSFSKLVEAPIRVWCKDKNKLKKHIEHKIFKNDGTKGILVTGLIKRENVLFDYETYNNLAESGALCEAFTGTLRGYAEEFKPMPKDTVKEVLVNASVNKAEVIEVINPFEDINQQQLVAEIKKSLGY
jgi:hypothetical protein